MRRSIITFIEEFVSDLINKIAYINGFPPYFFFGGLKFLFLGISVAVLLLINMKINEKENLVALTNVIPILVVFIFYKKNIFEAKLPFLVWIFMFSYLVFFFNVFTFTYVFLVRNNYNFFLISLIKFSGFFILSGFLFRITDLLFFLDNYNFDNILVSFYTSYIFSIGFVFFMDVMFLPFFIIGNIYLKIGGSIANFVVFLLFLLIKEIRAENLWEKTVKVSIVIAVIDILSYLFLVDILNIKI